MAGLAGKMAEIYPIRNLPRSRSGFGTLCVGYEETPADMAQVCQFADTNRVKLAFFEAGSMAYDKITALKIDKQTADPPIGRVCRS